MMKIETLEAARDLDLELLADMHGHPSISGYIRDGFEVISF